MRNYVGNIQHVHRKWPVFDRNSGMSVLFTLLLLVGLAGVFASPGFRDGTTLSAVDGKGVDVSLSGDMGGHLQAAREAGAVALAYYARKYGDRNVSVEVMPGENGTEVAYIRKNGFLVKRLSVSGNKVVEEHTGLHDWIFDLLTNVN